MNWENPEICAVCGGACCKRMPGDLLPSDVKDDKQTKLVKMFQSGKYGVGSWTHENHLRYYVRPRKKGDLSIIAEFGSGECIFLGEKGCELPHNKRPWECRILEPVANGSCIAHSKDWDKARKAWLPFQEMIKEAIKIAGG